MKKSPLKRRKGLRPVSEKQAAKDAVWRAITLRKAKDLGYICQWCGHFMWRHNMWVFVVGHHIIRRARGRIDEPSNCYVCHWLCHQFIGDNNIDVLQYPTLAAWNNREAKPAKME